MRQQQSKVLFEYWNRIRDGRKAPTREEIEPSDIRHLLADTFILEVSGTMRTISYRLAGTRLCASFGRELKGYGFLGLWAEKDCFEIAKVLAKVYQNFEPSIVCMRASTASGKTIDYEIILLPLMPMADGSTRILGAMISTTSPFWLGTEILVECQIRSSRLIDNDEAQHHQSPPLSPSLLPVEQLDKNRLSDRSNNEMLSEMAGAQRKIAHLTVHEGGKNRNS